MIKSDNSFRRRRGGPAAGRGRRHAYITGISGVAVLALLAACGGGAEGASSDQTTGASGELAKVSMRWDAAASGYDAPFVLALQKGWFKDAGLDITFGEGTGSGTTVQLVATGKETFGWADFGAMTKLVAQGAPVQSVGVFGQLSPVSIMTLEENGINSPMDLVGKTVGWDPQGASAVMFDAIAGKVGLDKSKVKLIALKSDQEAQMLVSGKTQAFAGFRTFQGPQVEELGGKLKVISGADVGVNLLNLSIVVSKDYATANKKQACSMVEVTAKAWEYAQQHPDEAIDALVKAYPNVKPDVAKKQLLWTAELLHTKNTQGQPLGKVADADVQETVSHLEQYGGMAKGVVDPSKLFTNECFS
jgi:NitT/TauT family transport system substrate-binding protein